MEQNNKSSNSAFKPPVDVTIKRTRKFDFSGMKEKFLKKPTKKRLLIVAGASLGLLVLGVGALYLFGPKPAEIGPEPTVESTYVAPVPTTMASPLTGVIVEKALAERPVTGIMVENSVDARPQSGLTDAGIVFEAIAEGGITRFLTLFQEAQPTNVGPIRSARPYYVEWAAGFGSRYLHSGGSGEALALIRSLGVKDIDHGAYGERIASRVSSRYAPHNVYTSMERIDALGTELGFTSSEFTPFARKEDVKAELPTASTINFDISGQNYNTKYSYDATSNSYLRNMAGLPHTDENNGKQIQPKVVIALITTYSIHSDKIHSVYKTTGSGSAIVFQDGIATTGTWKKDSQTSSLGFFNVDGTPLLLNAGQTWITAIPDGRTSYTP